MKKLFAFGLVMIMLATLVAGCGATPEPEVIIQTVEVEKEVKVIETVEVEVEVPVEAGEKTVVEFWSTDKEEDRVDLYEEIAARFMAENPDVDVRIVPIDEADQQIQSLPATAGQVRFDRRQRDVNHFTRHVIAIAQNRNFTGHLDPGVITCLTYLDGHLIGRSE